MSDIPTLLERFRRGPELVASALTGVSGAEEDFATAPGKWSIRQIAAHLADSELVGAHRLRQVIAEDNPTLIAFDQDAWTKNLDYSRRKAEQSLETFRRIRTENYELLKGSPGFRLGAHRQSHREWSDDVAAAAGGLCRPRGISRSTTSTDSRRLPGREVSLKGPPATDSKYSMRA